MHCTAFKQANALAVNQLFTDVFTQSEGDAEGQLLNRLVRDLVEKTPNDDIYGYVAEESDQVIGSIFFTRLSFENGPAAFLLAPVAVATARQGMGVGQKLIQFGIEQLEQTGVELLFTYGDPSFYGKVGFEPISESDIKAPFELTQPEGWLCQSLTNEAVQNLSDRPRCVEALNNPAYW